MGRQCLPHVDAELAPEHRKLVHQRDVHVPERVLDQLGQLRLARRGHGHGLVHDGGVEVLHRGQRARVDTRDDLRRGDQGPGEVPRVDALRAVAEVEVGPRGQPGPVFEPAPDLLLRGARVGRGFQDHGRARPQVAGQGAAGRLDAGQIGQAVPQRRGDRDHRDVEAVAVAGARRRPEPPAFQRRAKLVLGHVLHVRFPGFQALHPDQVGVVADHVVSDVRGPHRQREAHVAQSRHHHGAHRRAPVTLATRLENSGRPTVTRPPRLNRM
jgi:hypothetical protein